MKVSEMASLVCGLTGTAPEDPVFSKTGYIFERRVIEKYLKVNGNICPISEEALTIDDLLPIKGIYDEFYDHFMIIPIMYSKQIGETPTCNRYKYSRFTSSDAK